MEKKVKFLCKNIKMGTGKEKRKRKQIGIKCY